MPVKRDDFEKWMYQRIANIKSKRVRDREEIALRYELLEELNYILEIYKCKKLNNLTNEH